jgi:hypothetical protein
MNFFQAGIIEELTKLAHEAPVESAIVLVCRVVDEIEITY